MRDIITFSIFGGKRFEVTNTNVSMWMAGTLKETQRPFMEWVPVYGTTYYSLHLEEDKTNDPTGLQYWKAFSVANTKAFFFSEKPISDENEEEIPP